MSLAPPSVCPAAGGRDAGQPMERSTRALGKGSAASCWVKRKTPGDKRGSGEASMLALNERQR